MSLDPDARDFVRKYLADPGDGTAADRPRRNGRAWRRADAGADGNSGSAVPLRSRQG